MASINALEVFIAVVEEGSISGGARRLKIPKSTVSRRLKRLEEDLGVALLQRTTRALHLTDVGRRYHERCAQLLAGLQEAEAEARQSSLAPRGLLRITSPVIQGDASLGVCIATFLERFPEVELELLVTNRYVDLVDEGFDVALRAGQLRDSSLMAVQLVEISTVLVASPEYLAKHGAPETPEALSEHACLRQVSAEGGSFWRTREGQAIRIRGRLLANDLTTLHEAALRGLGIARLPEILLAEDLAAARLRVLLADAMTARSGLYLVYPANRQRSMKVRAFIEHTREHFAPLGGRI